MPEKFKISVYIATSLDGYIARADGGLDWLDVDPEISPGEDYGYHDFISSIDLMVMGRNTFDKVLSFEKWPYPDMDVMVLCHKNIELSSELDRVQCFAGTPGEIVKTLKKRGYQHVYTPDIAKIDLYKKSGHYPYYKE